MTEETYPLPQFVLEYLNRNPAAFSALNQNRTNPEAHNAVGSLRLFDSSRTPHKIDYAYNYFTQNIVLNSPPAYQREYKQLLFPLFINLAQQLFLSQDYQAPLDFIEKYRYEQPPQCQEKIQELINNRRIPKEVIPLKMCSEAYHQLLAKIDAVADNPNTAILSYIINSAVKVTEEEDINHEYLYSNDSSISRRPNSSELTNPVKVTLPPYSARYSGELSMQRPQLTSEEDIPCVHQSFPDIANIEIYNHHNRISDIQIAPNGRLFSFAQGPNVYLNTIDQLSNLGEHNTMRLVSHNTQILATAFSQDSRLFASSSIDGIIKISHLEAFIPYMRINTGVYPIFSLAFDYSGTFLACGCGDKTIKVYHTKDGSLLRLLIGHAQSPMKILFTRDSKRLISISEDMTVKFWDLYSSQPFIGSFTVPYIPTALALDPTNTKIAVGMINGCLSLWDTKNGTKLWESKNDLDSMITDIKFTLDGSMVLASGVNGIIGGWKWEEKEMVMKIDAVSSTIDQMIITERNSVLTAGRSVRGNVII
ncbi:hypothetical protein TVAG_343050 [Trichomonas vaginalis G3]|uniref:Uncharacterized protein n=1 Tax=Trichomonas vaginalis (strain ATCC PRA-98 / G3) TaxID=412133 RepID=A2EJR7_TRIV3|nr:transcription initiation from RNA polymerase II promoter [Trichomonas vaginalis G3]EAY07141.1 hypothetical protein TVAG_343050 [Trichomonas vaginalis G3]KAI5522496.1 transcription initiation from RNA polymerase II promoter [Trichomonas vaginalis G3]|eukprot:XP_001319364.1 hypothetical protein [Trichomonas vaginalis G3]